jgi:enoyl-CoA hydratase
MSDTCIRLIESKPGIVGVEINRPEALNALNSVVLQSLASTIEHIQSQAHVSVVVVKGAGEKAFVAGADIKEMLNFDQSQARDFSFYGQSVFSALAQLPQVVIAQVHGFALGGGLELALSADFIVASDKSRFGLPEVGLGLIPGFGGTQRLVARLGYARALEWMTSAERYTAEIAYQLGLLNRVVPHEQLDDAVEQLASQIANQGPLAVRRAKRAALAAASGAKDLGFEFEANLFGTCFTGSEAREGLAAFTEKRKPKFR